MGGYTLKLLNDIVVLKLSLAEVSGLLETQTKALEQLKLDSAEYLKTRDEMDSKIEAKYADSPEGVSLTTCESKLNEFERVLRVFEARAR